MPLNLRGPIPNAAAINSHLPDTVLLIRSKSNSKQGEEELDRSYERLQAWAKNALPELYEFDPDMRLAREGMSFAAEAPTNSPKIEVLEVGSLSSSTKEICEMISSICDSQGDLELRIDVAAGRKEDAAILARLPDVANLGDGWTVWYTDAISGTSVEIGGGRVEDGNRPLSHMTRFWLEGSPILGFKEVLLANEMKGELLTSVLDSIEKISKSSKKSRSKRIEFLTEDLDSRGIELETIFWDKKEERVRYFKAYRKGHEESYISLPASIWGSSGYWLEAIAALAIVEGWDCEHVYVGVSIGHHSHKSRMGPVKSMMQKGYGGGLLSRVWSDLNEIGMMPPQFSGLDFLDSNSYNPGVYRKNHHGKNLKEIKLFSNWVTQNWRELPLKMRQYMMHHCRARDLDVFAETASNCLFVECKLDPDAKDGKRVENAWSENKAQIDSIIASSAMRGVNFSILTHSRNEIDTWRTSSFDFVVPWSKLRRPNEMLKSVIKKVTPPMLGKSGLGMRGPQKNTRAGGGSGKKRRPRGALSKSRILARELKEALDKGEVSPEKAFELLFDSITTSNIIEVGGSLKERVVKSGVFERAIESGEKAILVVNAIQKEAGRGREWRDVFGAERGIKFVDYFNHVEPGLVRFRQGEDGDWYATQPDAANEEE
tara:strand:- start:215 stop:2185 length:1971 start_codon:yes stop_codon:yes gene_type:complete